MLKRCKKLKLGKGVVILYVFMCVRNSISMESVQLPCRVQNGVKKNDVRSRSRLVVNIVL